MKIRSRVLVAATVVVSAVSVALASGTASAHAPTTPAVRGLAVAGAGAVSTVAVGPRSMRPGGRVTVSGAGYRPGMVTVTLGAARVTATADGTGRFSARVQVPWATVPGVVTVTAVQGVRRASASLRVGVDWKVPGFNRAHSFVNPYEKQLTTTTVARLAVMGRFDAAGRDPDDPFGWFATVGDSAYACTLLGDVVKFDLTTRKPLWFYETGEEHGQRCGGEGGPYVDGNGDVWIGQILLDGANGDEFRWGFYYADATIAYGGLILAMPTAVGGGPFALDPKTGDVVWKATAGGTGGFITSPGVLYHWDGDILYATDPTSGRDLWAHTFPDGYLRDLASNGKQLIGVKSDTTGEPREVLASFDPQSGEPTWKVDLSGRSSFVTVDASRAYLIRSLTAKDDRTLVSVGLDGKQQWATPLPRADVLYHTRITQANGILYVPLYGALNTYDATTGALLDTLPLRDPAGDKVVPGTAIVDDGHVYLTTTTGVYDLTLP